MANLLLRAKSVATTILGVSTTYPINGFDASEGVGFLNWEQVRYSKEFNFCSFRACFGKDTDDQWSNNVKGVKSIAGYPWYPYFVPKFGNWEAETDYFLTLYDTAGGSSMPPEIDVQYKYNPLNKSQTLTWLEKSAMKISSRTGRRLLVYSNKSYWDTHVETGDYFRRETDLEVAQWNTWLDEPDLIPNDWKNLVQSWIIWQWYNKAIRPFAPGTIDVKRFYSNGTIFVEEFGIAPYYAPDPPIQTCDGVALCMVVLQQDLKIRKEPKVGDNVVGTLNAGEILNVLDVGGNNSWILHSRGWSNVRDGLDINMKKY